MRYQLITTTETAKGTANLRFCFTDRPPDLTNGFPADAARERLPSLGSRLSTRPDADAARAGASTHGEEPAHRSADLDEQPAAVGETVNRAR
ncbi:hypothetical protein [Nocardia sp. NPDC004750]